MNDTFIDKDLEILKEELKRLEDRGIAVVKAIEILEKEKIRVNEMNSVSDILNIVRRDNEAVNIFKIDKDLITK